MGSYSPVGFGSVREGLQRVRYPVFGDHPALPLFGLGAKLLRGIVQTVVGMHLCPIQQILSGQSGVHPFGSSHTGRQPLDACFTDNARQHGALVQVDNVDLVDSEIYRARLL